VLLEGIETIAPESPVGLEPLVELGEGLRAQGVQTSLAVDPDPDQAGFPQHPKVLRHAGLAEAEPEDQLVHRSLPVPQQVEDVASVRLGKHLEGGHRRTIYNSEVICPQSYG